MTTCRCCCNLPCMWSLLWYCRRTPTTLEGLNRQKRIDFRRHRFDRHSPLTCLRHAPLKWALSTVETFFSRAGWLPPGQRHLNSSELYMLVLWHMRVIASTASRGGAVLPRTCTTIAATKNVSNRYITYYKSVHGQKLIKTYTMIRHLAAPWHHQEEKGKKQITYMIDTHGIQCSICMYRTWTRCPPAGLWP